MRKLGIVTVVVTALLVIAVGIPAFGTPQPDDYPTNYQEECEAYRNHSGYISSYYDYAVFFEQGFEPIELHTNGEPIFLEPPDGIAWDRVYKCHYSMETTTTTIGESTTTTQVTTSSSQSETTTTTSSESTSTSVGESTTTTTDSTTTTDPGDPELPFTGPKLSVTLWVLIAGFLVTGGGVALWRARKA